MLEEFQEVENCGGKFKIKILKEGDQLSFSTSYESSNPFNMSVYGVYALYPQGIPVGVFNLGGINQGFQPQSPHESCLSIFMLSDRQGFFGRLCPSCQKYFRTKTPSASKAVTCPYCGLVADTHYFLTKGHHEFIKAHIDAYDEAIEKKRDVVIDLDDLARLVTPNRPPQYFVEETQQTYFKCVQCQVTTDIIGLFGYCPHCGHRNSMEMLENQLIEMEHNVNNPRYSSEQRNERTNEWRNIIKQCVSAFEGFARDLQNAILINSCFVPSRRRTIEKISFHNPIIAARDLKQLMDIDILCGINEQEQEFINRRFQRRHLYEHSAGVVDQEYIDKTGDTSVRLGQIVREESNNVLTLIKLTRKMAMNFDKAFHEMS